MKAKTQDYGNVTVIELQGELDGDFVEPLQAAVADVIRTGKVGVVLDMSGVIFIDSKGLEGLLQVRDHCSQNKCELRLAGLEQQPLDNDHFRKQRDGTGQRFLYRLRKRDRERQEVAERAVVRYGLILTDLLGAK